MGGMDDVMSRFFDYKHMKGRRVYKGRMLSKGKRKTMKRKEQERKKQRRYIQSKQVEAYCGVSMDVKTSWAARELTSTYSNLNNMVLSCVIILLYKLHVLLHSILKEIYTESIKLYMRHVEKFTGKPRDRRYFDTMIGFFQEKLRNIIFARDILHIVIIEDGKKNIFKKGN